MAVGRFFSNARASGRPIQTSGGFDLGAVGRKIGDFVNNTALPFLRDKAAPAVLNLVDPSLGETYTHAKDAIMEHKPWQDVVGGIADDVTGKVVPAALGKLAPQLKPGYEAVQKGVAEAKGAIGAGSTADLLKGQRPKNVSVNSAVSAGKALGTAYSEIRNANGKRQAL